MEFILNFPELKSIKVWRLATTDAHYLYQKFGYCHNGFMCRYGDSHIDRILT
jgi:hypothetical protein